SVSKADRVAASFRKTWWVGPLTYLEDIVMDRVQKSLFDSPGSPNRASGVVRRLRQLIIAGLTIGPDVPACAAQPTRVFEVLDITIPAPVTSAACGFAVFHRLTGTFTVTLFTDGGDLVVREVDGAKGARDTWFAPSQGTSYSYEFNGPTRYDYPEGATVGAP